LIFNAHVYIEFTLYQRRYVQVVCCKYKNFEDFKFTRTLSEEGGGNDYGVEDFS
jgi:hypothetical protein